MSNLQPGSVPLLNTGILAVVLLLTVQISILQPFVGQIPIVSTSCNCDTNYTSYCTIDQLRPITNNAFIPTYVSFGIIAVTMLCVFVLRYKHNIICSAYVACVSAVILITIIIGQSVVIGDVFGRILVHDASCQHTTKEYICTTDCHIISAAYLVPNSLAMVLILLFLCTIGSFIQSNRCPNHESTPLLPP